MRRRGARDDPSDPMPLTADEVNAFLDAVDPHYRLYFKLRCYTDLRSCEVNGLKVGYLDLGRRQLRVREALVDGCQTALKHRKTRRDVPLSPSLAAELRDHVQGKALEDYTFCRADGRPLTASWVAANVWGPSTGSAWSAGGCIRRATPRPCCISRPARIRCSSRACLATRRPRGSGPRRAYNVR